MNFFIFGSQDCIKHFCKELCLDGDYANIILVVILLKNTRLK